MARSGLQWPSVAAQSAKLPPGADTVEQVRIVVADAEAGYNPRWLRLTFVELSEGLTGIESKSWDGETFVDAYSLGWRQLVDIIRPVLLGLEHSEQRNNVKRAPRDPEDHHAKR